MRDKKMLMFLIVFLWNFSSFCAPEQNSLYVFEYTSDNFEQKINEQASFIKFYVPWCIACQEFAPVWNRFGELTNVKDSPVAIAKVDCAKYEDLCMGFGITGFPTLLYFMRGYMVPIHYKDSRDIDSLTFFLMSAPTMLEEPNARKEESSEVKIMRGMAYFSDHNIEKFVSNGQHFIMFYAPWCRASQKLAVFWAELAREYEHNEYIQVGKVNCMENDITCKTFDVKQYPFLMWIVNGRIMGISEANHFAELKAYVEKMLLAENHDPEKFMKKKKALPVARISEETFETFLENDLVFVNYFAPWCAHCMQLSPLWVQLGVKFQNESSVLIADVDCVRSKTICETEKINGLPTLILYKHKKIVNVEHGGKSLEALISMVNEHLDEKLESSEEVKEALPKDEL